MRRIRDVLTCLFESKFSERATSSYTGINRKTVSDYKTRFARSALSWPLPSEFDDAALELALYPLAIPAARQARQDIDFAPIHKTTENTGIGIHTWRKYRTQSGRQSWIKTINCQNWGRNAAYAATLEVGLVSPTTFCANRVTDRVRTSHSALWLNRKTAPGGVGRRHGRCRA